ncbi:MAG: hypothetical protein AMJ59_04395 [Gammaproteobacteria bacterium SG8_31]|jgi:SAM-dependent methyltransferase|nr:MAG: hypothetical protein AMJ59_04395 [Gammaproteobacteria bacterium SG8_31]
MQRYGPDHWEVLYRENRIPWDAGRVPEDLERYLATEPAASRALVPGCGSGYEAARLARAGMEVVAIDFSPAAVGRALEITRGSGARVMEADFFELEAGMFDLVYERAFMCAMPPGLRIAWARKCAELLVPNGLLLGFFFIDPTATDGPPFGIPPGGLADLLEADFRLEEDRMSEGSLPVFSGRERWQVWKRRSLEGASGSIVGPIYTEGS